MTKKASHVFRFSGFGILSSFVIRASSFSRCCCAGRKTSWIARGLSATTRAFTVLELLIVISIIIALAGLIIATTGYVQKKGARSRAEAEIAAMSAALESYKADNGNYPRDTNTDTLAAMTDPNFATKSPPDPLPTSYDPNTASYKNASLSLYKLISGDSDADGKPDGNKSYFGFKPLMLLRAKMSEDVSSSNPVQAIRDPFGNSYAYSTARANYQDDPGSNPNYGFNPTFDLWSTAGTSSGVQAGYEAQWIKNW